MSQATQDLEAVQRELAELRAQVDALAAGGSGPPATLGQATAGRMTDGASSSTARTEARTQRHDITKALIGMLGDAPPGQPAAAMIVGLVLGDRTGHWQSVTTRGPIGPAGDVGEAARVFAVLGHETRLRVLQLLWDGEKTAQELGEGTGLSAGALYHHVRELAAFRWAATPRRNAYAITPAGRQALVCAWQFSQFLTGRSRLKDPGAPPPEGDAAGFEPEPPAEAEPTG